MASSLKIIKELSNDNTWEIVASIEPGGELPLDIFIYENTGNTTLGEYQGVCSVDQYQKYQTFDFKAIPMFGNKYVKFTQAKIKVTNETESNQATSVLISDVKALSAAFKGSSSSTTLIDIP